MKHFGLGSIALAAMIAGPAMAADLPRKAPPPPPPVVYEWTGFYIGADVGKRWSRSEFLLTGVTGFAGYTAAGAVPVSFDGSNFRYGFYAGYNWQASSLVVLGAEADFGWGNNTQTRNGFLPGAPLTAIPLSQANENRSFETRWDWSLRARAGVLVTPQVLLYVTGGPSWQRFNTSAFCNNFQTGGNLTVCGNVGAPSQTVTNGATRSGWTFGGGIEGMLWSNWIARAEYRYSDYGTATLTDTVIAPALAAGAMSFTYNIRLRTQTALFGLAYKFGGPVIAKY
jgi:outer membrane immunogenic protein